MDKDTHTLWKRMAALAVLLLATIPAPAGPLSRIARKTEFSNIVLPSDDNIVFAEFQDSQGAMWFGTKSGLVFYDGFHFRSYFNSDNSAANSINVILQLDPETLCIGTDNGISFFDLRSGTFSRPDTALASIQATRSLALFGGDLWIGSWGQGLFRYSLSSGALESVPMGGLSETMVNDMCEMDGKLYVASYEALSCYNPETGVRRRIPIEGDPIIEAVIPVDGDLWIGARRHLYRWTPGGKMDSYAFNSSVTGMASALDGRLAVGCESGLYFLNKDSGEIEACLHSSADPKSLANNNVRSLLRDREGNLWVGTAHGVSCHHYSKTVREYSLLEVTGSSKGNIITQSLIDSQGGYWLGGDSGLIHVGPDGQTVWFSMDNPGHPLENDCINSIFEDSAGTVWIATNASIARYDGGQFVFCHLTDGGLYRSEWAYDLTEDAAGNLWIGTYKGGIYIVEGEQLRAWKGGPQPLVCNGLFEDPVLTSFYLKTDRKGSVWATTWSGTGLVRIDARTRDLASFQHYMDVMEYDGRYLWYSAKGEIVRLDPETMEAVPVEFKSSSSIVHTLLHENGRIWFTSADGVFYIDRNTLRVYPVEVPSRFFRSSCYDRNLGRILFGGEDCVVSLDLENLEQAMRSEKVYITGIASPERPLFPRMDYEGDDIRWRNELTLRRHPGDIYFELSSLTYPDNPQLLFYRISPSEKWTRLGLGNSRIPFFSPPGGTYTLEVASTDPALNPDTLVNTYRIRVPYPVFRSPLALWLYALAAVGIFLAVIALFRRAEKRKFEEQERRKTLEMADLKMRFMQDVSHELRTPLGKILEGCADDGDPEGSLSAVRDNADKLSRLVQRMAEASGEKDTEPPLSASDEKMLFGITAVIEEHMGEDRFNVAALAALLGMDQKTLYRKLMQTTGMSPVHYLRKVRLRKAALLLVQGRFTVSEVMYMVGFTNASYFSKCFQEEYGKTPREYMMEAGQMSE